MLGYDVARQMLKHMLDASFSLGSALGSGENELLLAARFADAQVLRLILSRSAPADVAATDCDGNTALHLAVGRKADDGEVAAVVTLLLSHIDGSAVNARGDSVLHIAAAFASADTLKLILSRIGNGAALPRCHNAEKRTPLHAVAADAVRLSGAAAALAKMQALLVASSPLAIACDTRGATPLHLAAAHGSADMVAALLDAGDNSLCSQADHDGNTALHYAALHATAALGEVAVQIVAVLVQRCPPASLGAANNCGETALHVASACACSEIVRALLNAGVSLLARSVAGLNALHYAAARSSTFGVLDELLRACEDEQSNGRDALYTPTTGPISALCGATSHVYMYHGALPLHGAVAHGAAGRRRVAVECSHACMRSVFTELC